MKPLTLVAALFVCRPAFALQLERVGEIRTRAVSHFVMLSDHYVHIGTDHERVAGKHHPVRSHFKVVDARQRRLVEVTFPIEAFLNRHRDTFPQFVAAQLVYYDGRRAALGFTRILEAERTDFFCNWDLKDYSSCQLVELGKYKGDRLYARIGPSPGGEHYYFGYHMKAPNQMTFRLGRVSLSDQSVDWPVEVPKEDRGPLLKLRKKVFSPDGTKIAMVEHGERRNYTDPYVYIVDIEKRSFEKFPALISAYCIAFSRDGKHLVLGSQELGQIVRLDVTTGKRKKTQGMKKVQLCFETPKAKTFYVLSDHLGGPKPIEVRRWSDLRRTQKIPIKKLFEGLNGIHPSGMLTTRDGKTLVSPIFRETGFPGENQGAYIFAVKD